MSKNFVFDIARMHEKFGVNTRVRELSKEHLELFLKFRKDFLAEELRELNEAKDADDVVDALIDLIVVAVGTLDAFDVDAYLAWDRVLDANMAKSPGVKASRPNPLGLPDMIKPDGWVGPTHVDNVGMLSKLYD